MASSARDSRLSVSCGYSFATVYYFFIFVNFKLIFWEKIKIDWLNEWVIIVINLIIIDLRKETGTGQYMMM